MMGTQFGDILETTNGNTKLSLAKLSKAKLSEVRPGRSKLSQHINIREAKALSVPMLSQV